MNKIKQFSLRKPIIFTITLVLLSISALFLTKLLVIESEINQDLLRSGIKNLITLALLYIIVRFGWLNHTYISTPMKAWHPKWWLATLPMMLITLINLVSIEWSSLEFNAVKLVAWLYTNFSTGLFEEILLRGLCFYLLFQAWRHQPNGLIKASLGQAVIFGFAHFINLTEMPLIDVTAQVIFATLIGLGFAGLVTFTRSIWPAIVVHTMINSAGSINNYFQPDFIRTEIPIASYIVMITMIFIICTVPGYFLLRKAQNKLEI